jgi:ribosomal peptide maturation radical SAM protein 1
MQILLIEPPWGASLRPSLGLHALKAHLEGRHPGYRVDIRYANLDFYDALPPSLDKALLHAVFWSNPEVSWLAEAFFSPWSYPDESTNDHLLADFRRRLTTMAADPTSERLVPPPLRHWLAAHLADALAVLDHVIPAFLDDFRREHALKQVDIVGFGHHFNQLFGAFAMARAAKTVRPELPVALGGASLTRPLAEVVAKTFPQIDHVFVGDAEAAFSDLCTRIMAGNPPRRSISSFAAGRSVTPDARLDYASFFSRVENTRFASQLRSVPIELTRDCYWARRSQCSFCGLPIERNTRSSNARDVVAKVKELADTLGVRHFIFADPAIHQRKHGPLIAALAEQFEGRQDQPIFFFEARADTPRRTLETLARLGNVVVQVGIESFSKRILDLMKKGVCPIENVQFLKWCKELGIFPYYNLLWGHPGEEPGDYQAMAALIPRIMHLTPPSGYTPVLLCRDSPLFEAGCSDIVSLKPWLEYAYLFPQLAEEDLFKVAYYFDYDAIDAAGAPISPRPALDRAVEDWRRHGRFGNIHLVHYREAGELVVSDNRGIAAGIERERVFRFRDPADLALLDELGAVRSTAELLDGLAGRGIETEPMALFGRLAELEAAGLVMREGDRNLLLSLAI